MATEFKKLRTKYHRKLCTELISYRDESAVLNFADGHSKASVDFARMLVQQMGAPIGKQSPKGQDVGQRFPKYTRDYLKAAFALLGHLRPGSWKWSVEQARVGIAAFEQYEHLDTLQRCVNEHPELKLALGGQYLIIPDLVVAREAVHDDEINRHAQLVDHKTRLGRLAPLRRSNVGAGKAILHASISCKWTMRSDRAQNTRTEALNLIRNRKGSSPHIVVVTMEPLPTRLASIAFGVGDVDCTYHAALYELQDIAKGSQHETQRDMLEELIEGRRLRDISDLPLDLAI